MAGGPTARNERDGEMLRACRIRLTCKYASIYVYIYCDDYDDDDDDGDGDEDDDVDVNEDDNHDNDDASLHACLSASVGIRSITVA